jgi:hypothetical protein
MRILRTIFLLTAVVILMPSPPESPKPDTSTAAMIAANEVSAPELFFAATRAASDFGGFCGREPHVCQTAAYVAAILEAKAKYSVKLIYDWANEGSGDTAPQQADGVDEIVTSSTRLAEGDARSQNTLTLEDKILPWRKPSIGVNPNG